MNGTADILREGVRRVVLIQALLTFCVALVFLYLLGWLAAVAAAYGGAIATSGAWWLGRRVWRAGSPAQRRQKMGVAILYLGFLERFGFALAAFALGVGILQLPAVPLVAAFGLAQFGYLAAAKHSSLA